MKKLLLRSGLVVVAILVVGLVAIWSGLRPPAPLEPETQAFTLKDVTVITPMRERHAHRSLRVAAGTIQSIGPAGNAGDDALAAYEGRFVLPGLFEMHTHLPPDNPLKLTGYFALLFLSHGVTSIRNAGDGDGTSVPAYQALVENGPVPGPRLFDCGPFFSETDPRWENSILLREPGDAQAAVARLAGDGVDCLKAHDGLSLARLEDLKAAAQEYNLPVMGHVPAQLAYEEALIPDAQHFYGVPEPASLTGDDFIARMADWHEVDDARLTTIVAATLRHGLANTPTLIRSRQVLKYRDYEAAVNDPAMALMPRMFPEVVWHPQEGLPFYRNASAQDLDGIEGGLARKLDLVARLHTAGAKLHLGADLGPFIVPGAALHDEMVMFQRAGLSPEEIWALATWKAAQWWGESLLGTVREGAPADFLIFREDPTRDLAALGTLEAVVVKGELFTKSSMDAKIEEYRRHFEGIVFDTLSVAAARRAMEQLFQEAGEGVTPSP